MVVASASRTNILCTNNACDTAASRFYDSRPVSQQLQTSKPCTCCLARQEKPLSYSTAERGKARGVWLRVLDTVNDGAVSTPQYCKQLSSGGSLHYLIAMLADRCASPAMHWPFMLQACCDQFKLKPHIMNTYTSITHGKLE